MNCRSPFQSNINILQPFNCSTKEPFKRLLNCVSNTYFLLTLHSHDRLCLSDRMVMFANAHARCLFGLFFYFEGYPQGFFCCDLVTSIVFIFNLHKDEMSNWNNLTCKKNRFFPNFIELKIWTLPWCRRKKIQRQLVELSNQISCN